MSRPFATTPYTPDPAVYPGAVRIPFLRLGKTQVVGNVNATENRLSLATLTFKAPLPALEAQRSLFLSGACPLEYDGVQVHEAGFHFFPEQFTAVASSGGVGSLSPSKTYGFIFLYEWEDAKGVTHRSETSVPKSVALGVGDDTVTCAVPYLRLTDKQRAGIANNSSVRIVAFRTQGDGTVYYRDPPHTATSTSSGRTGLYNNPGLLIPGSHVSFLSDTLIAANEILYTTGGGLDNQPYPSCTVACTHQRRVFMVTQEEQSFVQYTDEIDERFFAPATNEVYRIPVPVEGGSVVALASMDEKLIILCQRRIYFIVGEGPNRLGQQNGYSLPQLCSAKVGALGGCHESLALTPDGLWFMSSTRGLRLLTRGLAIAQEGSQYVGSDADGLIPNPVNTIRALSIDAKNQVRWYLSDTTVAVWDYVQHKWSQFTNHDSSGGAVSTRDTFWHSDGVNLFSADSLSGTYDDGAASFTALQTAWIPLADLQGYQRVYSLMILAEALKGSNRVIVATRYDYSDEYHLGALVGYATGAVARTAVNFTGEVGTRCAPGDLVTGATSGAVGTVVYYDDVNNTVYFSAQVGTFTNAEGLITSVGWSAVAAVSGGGNRPALAFPVFSSPVVSVGDFFRGLTSQAATFSVTAISTALGGTIALYRTQFIGGTFSPSERVQVYNQPSSYPVTAAANPLQLEHRLPIQKCEAVQFGFTFINDGAAGETIRLTGLTLSVGVKPGLHRLPESQRF